MGSSPVKATLRALSRNARGPHPFGMDIVIIQNGCRWLCPPRWLGR